MIYQKNKIDKNKEIITEIDNKKFNDSRFLEIGKKSIQNTTLNSINDDTTFETNSVRILYTLPLNSFTLVSDKERNIYLIKIKNASQKNFNENDADYKEFVNKMNIDKRTSILKSLKLRLIII